MKRNVGRIDAVARAVAGTVRVIEEATRRGLPSRGLGSDGCPGD
ncbi:MAG: hypothetical protein ACOCPY_00100 [Halorubrum sp.]